jgi:hypothetical protein
MRRAPRTGPDSNGDSNGTNPGSTLVGKRASVPAWVDSHGLPARTL